MVKLLIERDGVELNLKDNGGRTALLFAGYEGHADVVKLLIEHDGVELNLKDDNGQTVLSRAASQGHAEVVKLLLEQKDIEPESTYPAPLMLAQQSGHVMVSYLLSCYKSGTQPAPSDWRRRKQQQRHAEKIRDRPPSGIRDRPPPLPPQPPPPSSRSTVVDRQQYAGRWQSPSFVFSSVRAPYRARPLPSYARTYSLS